MAPRAKVMEEPERRPEMVAGARAAVVITTILTMVVVVQTTLPMAAVAPSCTMMPTTKSRRPLAIRTMEAC